MAFEIKALITDEGSRRTAEAWATGKNFIITGFALGNGGHDPLDTSLALSPEPSLVEVPSLVFGPKALAAFTFASDTCPVFECFLDYSEAVALFSSVCLIGQVLSSPLPNDPEVGSTFLFAVANFPQRSKTDTEKLTIKVGVTR